jgi:hypothetical protein
MHLTPGLSGYAGPALVTPLFHEYNGASSEGIVAFLCI